MSIESLSWICRIIAPVVSVLAWWIDRKQGNGFLKIHLKAVVATFSAVAFYAFVWVGAELAVLYRMTDPYHFTKVAVIFPGAILFGLSFPIFAVMDSFLTEPYGDYLNYESDEILGVRWHWRYKKGTIAESELRTFCPKEGCLKRLELQVNQNPSNLMPEHGQPISLVCERCGFKRDFDSNMVRLSASVLAEIHRRVATGECRQTLES